MRQSSKTYDPKRVEPKIYRLWEKSGCLNPNQKEKNEKRKMKKQKTYTVVLPPPNITGSLHMGHALNSATQDILIRWRRMQGYKSLWLPGTDHAGIATQNVVEKELKKEGLTRHDLGREKFIERVWEWRKKYGDIILDQLKKLGASCDWSRTRFTMDKNYIRAVEAAFVHYYEKGLIYRGTRTVSWCTRCQTSLSDLEVEYRDEIGKLYYITYGPLKLATVRPETKLGDTALAVHPKDERYKTYVENTIEIDSIRTEGELKKPERTKIRIRVVADEAVDPEFGTGVVKITPAHDVTDFEIAQRHNIPMRQIIDQYGRMNEHAGKYKGLAVADARKKITEDLRTIGLLVKEEDYPHRIAVCYRCGTVIEPLPSAQWFLKMGGLAQLAIDAVRKGEVRFHPKRWEKVYFDWLAHIHDWCISRQLWWGHRIPVWQCQTGIRNEKSDEYFISLTPPKSCLICRRCKPKQSEDVLDTWFSSALWPFATLGWPRQTFSSKNLGEQDQTKNDLQKFYPTQVLSTDRGIINLWVARMIFSSYEFLKIKPFSDVYIHATVLTREGKRMSKSLGTGIDPLDLIGKYGADATRFGLIWQAMGGQDIRFAEEHFIAGKKFCNKMWNAARFVVVNKPPQNYAELRPSAMGGRRTTQNIAKEDQKILKDLAKLVQLTNSDLEKFRFGQALNRLYHFFWHTFCDKYIEYAKTSSGAGTKSVLFFTLVTLLKLLHPFMPFVTEEIYRTLPLKQKGLLIIEEWPQYKNLKD